MTYKYQIIRTNNTTEVHGLGRIGSRARVRNLYEIRDAGGRIVKAACMRPFLTTQRQSLLWIGEIA